MSKHRTASCVRATARAAAGGWIVVALAGPVAATAGGVDRDPVREHVQQLDAQDVKRLYLACSREATDRRMGFGDAAACSIVYDVLLTRHFGGDYGALHAWSRTVRASAAGPARPAPRPARAGGDR